MIRLILIETRKLRGSLALLLAVVAPGLLGVLTMLGVIAGNRPPGWGSIFGSLVLPLWALFLLPMASAAFTTLVAQIEHRGRGWDHLLALPVPRWRIFAAKAVVVLLAVAAMTALMIGLTLLGAWAGGVVRGAMPVGAVPWQHIAAATPRIALAATLLVSLQLWVALRFANFVVPLAVGIGGTLATLAVMMTRTDKADWFPWVLPVRVVTGGDPAPFVWLGAVGGLIALAAMVVDLSRRAMR